MSYCGACKSSFPDFTFHSCGPHDRTPVAVAEATFRLFGVDLRCYVLDNGQRIINADDVAKLFAVRDADAAADSGDLADFAAWQKGER